MPDLPITALPPASTVEAEDDFAIVQSGTTKRATLDQVRLALALPYHTTPTALVVAQDITEVLTLGPGSAFVALASSIKTVSVPVDMTVVFHVSLELARISNLAGGGINTVVGGSIDVDDGGGFEAVITANFPDITDATYLPVYYGLQGGTFSRTFARDLDAGVHEIKVAVGKGADGATVHLNHSALTSGWVMVAPLPVLVVGALYEDQAEASAELGELNIGGRLYEDQAEASAIAGDTSASSGPFAFYDLATGGALAGGTQVSSGPIAYFDFAAGGPVAGGMSFVAPRYADAASGRAVAGDTSGSSAGHSDHADGGPLAGDSSASSSP